MEKVEDRYGPQCSGDNLFTKKARLLQSYYRVEHLKEKTFGIGPNRNSAHKLSKRPSYYGNMLVDGDTTGKNFFYRETFEYAESRVRQKLKEETIDAYRLFNNMLSSMPMAFNLFHPLILIKEKYPKALNQMMRDALPTLAIDDVDEIKIEFIPTPLKDYTNDKSAMDAAILFKDEKGEKYLLAIEVKYTDSLGTNKATDNLVKYQVAEELNQFTDAGLKLIKAGSQQIFRNYLLTEKYRTKVHLKDSYSIILAPKAHPSTNMEIAMIKSKFKT